MTDLGDWYSKEYNGGKLGEKFGYMRGGAGQVQCFCIEDHTMSLCHLGPNTYYVNIDLEALQSLWKVRQLQLMRLEGVLKKSIPAEQAKGAVRLEPKGEELSC